MTDFYTEWITIRDRHRVRLACRDSFPSSCMRLAAEAAAMTLDSFEEAEYGAFGPRLLGIFMDERNGCFNVEIGSDDPNDAGRTDHVRNVLHGMFDCGNWQPDFKLVAKGRRDHDAYDHARHLQEAKAIRPPEAPAIRNDEADDGGIDIAVAKSRYFLIEAHRGLADAQTIDELEEAKRNIELAVNVIDGAIERIRKWRSASNAP